MVVAGIGWGGEGAVGEIYLLPSKAVMKNITGVCLGQTGIYTNRLLLIELSNYPSKFSLPGIAMRASQYLKVGQKVINN